MNEVAAAVKISPYGPSAEEMAMSDDRFDDLFAHIAGQSGGIKPLLDSFFGFLHRKTDFYVQFDAQFQTQHYSMGFPKGMAEKMLLQSFRKYSMKELAANPPSERTSVPLSDTESAKVTASPLPAVSKKPETVMKSNPVHELSSHDTGRSDQIDTTTSAASGSNSRHRSAQSAIQYTDKGTQMPVGNGGVADNYYWTQTLKDLTVYVDVATGGVRGKDVKCTMGPRRLYLSIKNEVMIDGEMEDAIKTDESMWTISRSRDSNGGAEMQQIVLTIDKSRHTWWKHVIIGHPEIDTNKVDSTQNINEYDEVTQATIRKIMWEQQQKRLGNIHDSSSSDDPMQSIIQKAASLPGSPI